MNKQLSQLKREIKALNKDGWNVPYGIIMDSFEDFIKLERQEIIDKIEIKEKVIIQTLRNIDTDEYTIRDIIDVFTDLK